MKTLQIGRGRDFEVLDLPTPRPGPGQVLLRVEAVTTCPQWDLHLRHNEPMFVGHEFSYPYTPGQPGHEATGQVVEVGPGVTSVAAGDRVSTWRDPGHHLRGCYAQYVLLDAEIVIRVPADLPPEATAPVELATSVAASFLMLRAMGAVSGRRFGVMGLGPAGLIAAQLARAEGAAEVIGFDLAPSRRELALRLGVDRACDTRDNPAEAFPWRWTMPAIDCAIDCVGAKATVEWLMDRTADTVALFGVQREEYAFAPRHYYPALRLCGYPGPSVPGAEYVVGLIEAGKLDLGPLSTHTLPLERYAEAIDLLENQEAVKVCFRPWQ